MTSIWMNIWQTVQQTTWLEWVGTVFGLLTVWYSVKANILCWPTGMVSVAAYAILFFHIHLYADALLQIFFFVVSALGWWQWSKKANNDHELPITMLNSKNRISIFFFMVACILFSGWFFSKFTDAHIPFWDSTATGMSVTAQLLMMRKKLENWILWILVDILSIGIYYYKQVYLTTGLYAVFLIMATMGHFEWLKLYRRQSNPNLDTASS